jgi:hypothetical protein
MVLVLNFRRDVTENLYLADYRYGQVNIDTLTKKITNLYSTDIYLRRDHPLFNVGVLFKSLYSVAYGSRYYYKLRDIDEDLEIMCNQLLTVKHPIQN